MTLEVKVFSNDNGIKTGIIVLDFDGTMTKKDVCDDIMRRFTSGWEEIGKLHDEGDISHHELNKQFCALLKAPPVEIREFLKGENFLREGLVEFVQNAVRRDNPLYILSGGWDFYIKEILENEGGFKNLNFIKKVGDAQRGKVNVISNRVNYENHAWTIERPSTKSFLSSPSKEITLAEIRELTDSPIIYFGDGSTDYQAVQQADQVFAFGKLAAYCSENKIPHTELHSFKNTDFGSDKSANLQATYPSLLNILREKYFLAPDAENINQVFNIVNSGLTSAVKNQGIGPNYPSDDHRPKQKEIISSARLTKGLNPDPENFLRTELPMMLRHGIKAGHPFMVKNIIPVPSSIFLSAYLAASFYGQNGVTGEDAGDAAYSELRVAAMMSEMAGYDKTLAAGVFTFGGTGTNMYGIKMGLAKCLPEHCANGVLDDVFVVGSKPAHYSHVTAADWLGIGRKNYIHAKSNIDQTTDMHDLEEKCRAILENDGKIACIIGAGGTTSNMGIDNFKAIKKMRDKLVQDFNLTYIPHIHADSVVGWPYLYFNDYDFKENSLGFTNETLRRIELATKQISTISHADSFGIDFHKTGFMPYNASMVICKKEEDLQALGRDAKLMAPLFHDEEIYNPGKVTLETSRSSATMVASYVTLQAFGKDGYRVLLGHAQEMARLVHKIIDGHADKGLYVANRSGYGTDIFVRCYPKGIEPQSEFLKDLNDDNVLKKNSEYTSSFFKWLTQDSNPYKEKFAISKTSAAFYTNSDQPLVALRLYVLSPYTSPETAKELAELLVRAKSNFDETLGLASGKNQKLVIQKPSLGIDG